MNACMCVCMYDVCTYLCMYVRMYVYIFVRVFVYMRGTCMHEHVSDSMFMCKSESES